MKSENIAAIDLGTNSFHLVVVRTTASGKFDVIADEKESVRLGSGGGDLDHLKPDAIERGIATLKNFAAIARTQNARIRAVATSALREARNRTEFLDRARKECGLEIEVIPGHEEARLIYLGILQNMPLHDRRILLVDIGGGSTEFLVGRNGKPDYAVSLKLGAIRLKDRFFPEDPITENSVRECRHFIRVALAGVAEAVQEVGYEVAIGSSGTIETLAKMLQVEGAGADSELAELEITLPHLGGLVQTIVGIPDSKKRAQLPGLDERRADIIVGGAILVEEIFQLLGIERMLISDFALREGVIVDTLQRAGAKHSHFPDIRRSSVQHLAENLLRPESPALRSAEHCAQLAVRLLDQLTMNKIVRGLSLNDSFLLESGALLHNVGTIIAHSGHHKHSYYIIKNTEALLGFTRLELEIIALIARFHRKALPARKHSEFTALPPPEQTLVRLAAGILRVAVGLERGMRQNVRDVLVRPEQSERKIIIEVIPRRTPGGRDEDVSLELWAARSKTELLEQALNRQIEIEVRDV
ncbi:MAG: Ppx/GppA family phosphatase [Leptospiraceae bacterium]|nr:Ppx/GppA family phosphatase [Leptospiraceae bacterium]